MMTVQQMLSDLGAPGDGEEMPTNRPPHPDSISGALVDWCKLSAEEQIWQFEERAFERRLKSHIRALSEKKIDQQQLIAIAKKHREEWRRKRIGTEPRSVRKRQAQYDDFDNMSEPNWRDI